jgi:catechol 2,3-dioxygenase-like lactoylglutathione lyase family enzyme
VSVKALQIARIGLNVADPDGARRFYEDALGFSRAGETVLRLGAQEIELRAATGAPYPQARAANDPWFQHFAIAVSDMDAAYARIRRQPPISAGGPQLLPPSTGSVTAYKFRDPDGHPLELSYIPGSAWLADARGGQGPFLGIDHTALAVRNLTASLAFYTGILGFAQDGQSLNRGPEQDRLDGLSDAQVDIVSVKTRRPGPHIELLHYRSPVSGADGAVSDQDIAATLTTIQIDDIESVKRDLDVAAVLYEADGDRLFVRDPDGHRLALFA